MFSHLPKRSVLVATSAAAALLSGCMTPADTSATPRPHAQAELRDAAGTALGIAKLSPVDGGLRLEIEVQQLSAGAHGIHLHSIGRCDGPDFTTAGPHWNPAGRKHGLRSADGGHAGDMPNIESQGATTTHYSYELQGDSLSEGARAVLDSDGTAIVIHAGPDDNVTDPSGNSGGRILCGVFVPAN